MDIITYLFTTIIEFIDISKIEYYTRFFILLNSSVLYNVFFIDTCIFTSFSLYTLLVILGLITFLWIIIFGLKSLKKNWKIIIPSLIVVIIFVEKFRYVYNNLESLNSCFILNIYTVLILYLLIYLFIFSIIFLKEGYLSNFVKKISTLSLLRICSIPVLDIMHVHINKEIILEWFINEFTVLYGIIYVFILILSPIVEDIIIKILNIPIKEFLVKIFNMVKIWIYDLFNNILNHIIKINLLDVKVPTFKVYIPNFNIKPYTPEILYNSLTVFIQDVVHFISKYNYMHSYLYNTVVENQESKYIKISKPLVSTMLLMDNPNSSGSFINFHSNPNLDVNEPESNVNQQESNENDDWKEPEYYYQVEFFHDLYVKWELIEPLKKDSIHDLYDFCPYHLEGIEIYGKPMWFTFVQENMKQLMPHPEYLRLNIGGSGTLSRRLRFLIEDVSTGRYTNFVRDVYCPHERRTMYKDALYTLSPQNNSVLTDKSFVRVSKNITKYLSTHYYTGISHVRLIHGLIHNQFFFALSGMSPDIVDERIKAILPSVNEINNELQKFQYKITIHKVEDEEFEESIAEEKMLLLENKKIKDGKRLIQEVQYMRDYAHYTTSVILKHLPEERKITWGTPRSLR